MDDRSYKSKEILGYIVNGLTIPVYFVLLSVLEIPPALNILKYAGFIFSIVGMALVILAIATLLRKNTKDVIDSGIFSVVRHPLYLGAMFMFLSMAFFLPHWIMVILSIVNMIILYWFMIGEEKRNTEKFGDDYERYMQSVPRVNPLAGFILLLRRRRREK